MSNGLGLLEDSPSLRERLAELVLSAESPRRGCFWDVHDPKVPLLPREFRDVEWPAEALNFAFGSPAGLASEGNQVIDSLRRKISAVSSQRGTVTTDTMNDW